MSLNDEMLRVTGGPTVNDGLASYFNKQDNQSLQDAELNWLDTVHVSNTGGTIQDRWYNYLTAIKGYSGSLNDMLLQYWTNEV